MMVVMEPIEDETVVDILERVAKVLGTMTDVLEDHEQRISNLEKITKGQLERETIIK